MNSTMKFLNVIPAIVTVLGAVVIAAPFLISRVWICGCLGFP